MDDHDGVWNQCKGLLIGTAYGSAYEKVMADGGGMVYPPRLLLSERGRVDGARPAHWIGHEGVVSAAIVGAPAFDSQRAPPRARSESKGRAGGSARRGY